MGGTIAFGKCSGVFFFFSFCIVCGRVGKFNQQELSSSSVVSFNESIPVLSYRIHEIGRVVFF